MSSEIICMKKINPQEAGRCCISQFLQQHDLYNGYYYRPVKMYCQFNIVSQTCLLVVLELTEDNTRAHNITTEVFTQTNHKRPSRKHPNVTNIDETLSFSIFFGNIRLAEHFRRK